MESEPILPIKDFDEVVGKFSGGLDTMSIDLLVGTPEGYGKINTLSTYVHILKWIAPYFSYTC